MSDESVDDGALPKDQKIAHELAVSQQQATELAGDLEQYQMSSSDFARRFHAGSLGDDVDFIEWNAFYKMWCSVQKRRFLQLN